MRLLFIVVFFTVISCILSSCTDDGLVWNKPDDICAPLNISNSHMLFNKKLDNEIHVFNTGLVTFGENVTQCAVCNVSCLLNNDTPFIAGFSTFQNTFSHDFYRDIRSNSDTNFTELKDYIMCLIDESVESVGSAGDLDPTDIAVLQWRIKHDDMQILNSTIALASNPDIGVTYALLLYEGGNGSCNVIPTDLMIGFHAGNSMFHSVPYYGQLGCTEDNDRINGTYVYRIDLPQVKCISCEPLSDPANGIVTIVSNSTHLIAQYECNAGYYLMGDATRICGCNGQWSGDDVTCEVPTIQFIDGTPKVSFSNVTAEFIVSHNLEIQKIVCWLRNSRIGINMTNKNCQDNNGLLVYQNLPPTVTQYFLNIAVEYSNGHKTLETKFRVYGDQEGFYCGVNMINTGTKALDPNTDYLEFTSVGASQYFDVLVLDGLNEEIPEAVVCTPDVSNNIMEPGTPIDCKVFLNMSSIFTESCGLKEYTLIVKPLKYEYPTAMPGDDITKICEIKESRKKITHRFSVNNQC